MVLRTVISFPYNFFSWHDLKPNSVFDLVCSLRHLRALFLFWTQFLHFFLIILIFLNRCHAPCSFVNFLHHSIWISLTCLYPFLLVINLPFGHSLLLYPPNCPCHYNFWHSSMHHSFHMPPIHLRLCALTTPTVFASPKISARYLLFSPISLPRSSHQIFFSKLSDPIYLILLAAKCLGT